MLAHRLSFFILKWRGFFFKKCIFKWRPFHWRGLYFSNPLGTAGGLDKSAENLQGWWSLGAGFLEIGTITPKKQKGNSGSVLKRSVEDLCLWNYMGFPNRGSDFVLSKLRKIKKFHTPVFISIGKNKDTPLKSAHEDYTYLIQKFSSLASGFIVNISSPNTLGLRELFHPDFFEVFLKAVSVETRKKPLLLKMSPDLSDENFLKTLNLSEKYVDGWVICNTSLKRDEKGKFPPFGGISGKPLAPRSESLLKMTVQFLEKRRRDKLIISSGGVLSSEDISNRLSLGADLVQVYSALVFFGPGFFKKSYRDLS